MFLRGSQYVVLQLHVADQTKPERYKIGESEGKNEGEKCGLDGMSLRKRRLLDEAWVPKGEEGY